MNKPIFKTVLSRKSGGRQCFSVVSTETHRQTAIPPARCKTGLKAAHVFTPTFWKTLLGFCWFHFSKSCGTMAGQTKTLNHITKSYLSMILAYVMGWKHSAVGFCSVVLGQLQPGWVASGQFQCERGSLSGYGGELASLCNDLILHLHQTIF